VNIDGHIKRSLLYIVVKGKVSRDGGKDGSMEQSRCSLGLNGFTNAFSVENKSAVLKLRSIEKHIHRCKIRVLSSGGFCYLHLGVLVTANSHSSFKDPDLTEKDESNGTGFCIHNVDTLFHNLPKPGLEWSH
jgi:hypothetical protein